MPRPPIQLAPSSPRRAYDLLQPCCVDDLALANETIAGTQSLTAGDTVTLGPNLVVNGTSVEVVAGVKVIFMSGVEIGGTFSAGTDSGLICP